MSAPSIVIVSLITRGCLYLVRVLRGSQPQESAGTRKKERKSHVVRDATKVSRGFLFTKRGFLLHQFGEIAADIKNDANAEIACIYVLRKCFLQKVY